MKKIVLVLVLMFMIMTVSVGCGTPEVFAPSNGNNEKNFEGIYEGSALGYHGELKVKVALDGDGKILSIDVDEEHDETKDIGTVPIEKVPKAIVSSQSLMVDFVSGATITAEAVVSAVANALSAAGLDPSAYGFKPVETAVREDFTLDISALPKKSPKTDSITIKDVKGREVKLGLPISTYGISTMDVIDFIIPILGEDAFHQLVASGQDGGGGLQGYARLYTPVIGDYMKHVGQISDHNAPFDLEMILATDPDVIIVNSAMGAHKYALEVEDQLTAAGIPIILIDVPGESFKTSVQDTANLLGQIFQKEDRSSELVKFIDAQYALLASKNLEELIDKPTFYYEKSGYSEIFGSTSSSVSGWGAVLAAAGGDNIADPILLETAGAKGGGNTIDPEFVLVSDPDFVILSGSGAGWMDNFEGSTPSTPKFDILRRTGWNKLKAVKDNNVYEIAHATSRSVFSFHAALKMATIFYPDEFKGIDPDAIMDEFFEKFMLVPSDVTGWFYRAPGTN